MTNTNILLFLILFGGFFLAFLLADIIFELIKPKLNKSKSFTVYYTLVRSDKTKIRLYYNGTNFQSVLAEDYTKEELEQEFAIERINVDVAKEIYNILANTIEMETKHGEKTTVKAIVVRGKDGNVYTPLFRTPQDYDAFLKQIF